MIVGARLEEAPVPDSATVAVGVFGSLLVMVMLPESLPAVVGVKETFIVALPPGAMVPGVVIPETPKGPGLMEIREIIRLAPPLLVMLSEPLVVVPTVVLPKFRLVKLKLICCGDAVAMPASGSCPDETPLLV